MRLAQLPAARLGGRVPEPRRTFAPARPAAQVAGCAPRPLPPQLVPAGVHVVPEQPHLGPRGRQDEGVEVVKLGAPRGLGEHVLVLQRNDGVSHGAPASETPLPQQGPLPPDSGTLLRTSSTASPRGLAESTWSTSSVARAWKSGHRAPKREATERGGELASRRGFVAAKPPRVLQGGGGGLTSALPAAGRPRHHRHPRPAAVPPLQAACEAPGA